MEFQSLTVEVKASISDYSILELSKAPFMVHLAGRVYEEDLGETSGLPIRSVSVLSKEEVLTLKIHGDLSSTGTPCAPNCHDSSNIPLDHFTIKETNKVLKV